MTPFWAVVVLLVFSGASFFFALAESALFSLGKWQIRQLVESSPKSGEKVSRLLSQPQELLATIVLGNTFANATIVATVLWMMRFERWPLLPAGLGALTLILFGGEVAPKTLAVRAPEFWAGRIAGPMAWLIRLMKPLRQIAQKINTFILSGIVPSSVKPQTTMSDEEYEELLELAHQQGALRQTEKEIILQIISLDRRTAKDVMKPRSQMAAIPDDLPLEEMVAAARRFRHGRLPIYDETPDTIVGILNTRALLLDPRTDLSEVIDLPSFVPETMNLLQLLKSLQRQRRGLAVVLDEFGTTAGIVTMEDVLEEMVGEIRREGETDPLVMEKLSPGKWRVGGTMRIDDFRREYPEIGEVEAVETLGGLLVHELEVVPAAGQSTVFRGLKLTAQTADERRVRELLVEVVKRK